MKNKNFITFAIAAVGIGLGALIMFVRPLDSDHDHEGHDHGAEEEEFARGPHNGRLLRDGDLALEMTIFEDGVPPEFRVYAYRSDKPIEPAKVALAVDLVRLGGVTDKFTFKVEGDYLRGQGTVVEPHSFDVKIGARIENKVHNWAYQSYVGRVEIAPEAAAAGGIKIETAGPASIRSSAVVTGRIIVDPSRSAQITARFPGVLRELRKSLGEAVAKGEVIAMVESNDSLQVYAIKSPVDGIIYSQNARVGEIVGSMPIVEVGDMRRVVAELQVFPQDAAKLKVGQPVRVSAIDGDMSSDSWLSMISPTTEVGSQSVPVRVVLDNTNNAWRPGMLIEADITIGTTEVPLAVSTNALQRFRDFDVVFAKVGDTYEVRMLELGAKDNDFIEVIGGLVPGTVYVTDNSFLIKADIEKSGASHDH